MKIEEVVVTPEMAKAWLEFNTHNRDIRESHVIGLAESIKRGEWMFFHQGIAFGESGRLIDGQHRLLAIIKANRSVPMLVFRDVDDAAYAVTDLTRKRSSADIFHVSKQLAAVARFFAALEGRISNQSSITPQYIVPFLEVLGPVHEELKMFAPMTKRIWSSAPVQSAAIMRMLDGEDPDYVKLVYRSLVYLELDSMVPAAQSLFRQVNEGKLPRTNPVDLFARCLKVFDHASRDTKKIQVAQTDSALAYAREVIGRVVRGRHSPMPITAKRSNVYLNDRKETR